MSHQHGPREIDEQMEKMDGIATTRRSSSDLGHDVLDDLDGEDSEDDHEIELELTVEYMNNGQSDLEAEEYAAAEENFRAALELAEEHDFSRKLDYGPGDITLVLADCLTRHDKEEEALELLEPIADGSPRGHTDSASVRAGDVIDGSRDQITQYKACHILGTVFLKREDYQAAEKRAQQAFKGRRKVCGAQSPATLESVQLLIDIYNAKDDKTKARAYRRFLEPSTKGRPSVGGESSVSASAVSSAQPASTEAPVAATISAPVPATLERSDTVASASMIPAALQTKKSPPTSPLTIHTLSASTSSHATSPPNNVLPPISENERLVETPQVPTTLPVTTTAATTETGASEIPESIRKAMQSAAAPSIRSVPTPTDSRKAKTDSFSSTSTSQSASRAALASIFSSVEQKSAKTIEEPEALDTSLEPHPSPTAPVHPSPRGSTHQDTVATPPPARVAAELPLTSKSLPPPPPSTVITYAGLSTPPPASPVPEKVVEEPAPPAVIDVKPPASKVLPTSTQPPIETAPVHEDPKREELAPPSKSFSWLQDTKISVPSSIAKLAFPSGMSTIASGRSDVNTMGPPMQPDPMPANIGSSATTKKKVFGLSFSRSKTDTNPRKISAPSPMPGSAATAYTSSRNTSVTTLQSTVEPKRQMSLASSITAPSLSFLNKEYTYASEKSPKNSISGRSYSTSTHPPSRQRQELAPKFAQIKSLRDGKKSASVDAAMKLLREYDPDKKVLMIREAEIKKNMKEGYKGLASTGHGYAPVHFFCERKVEAALEVELLIEQGVDVNAVACKAGMPGHDPFTPLQRAVEHGHTEIVRLLVDADVVIAPPKPQKGAATAGNKDAMTQPLLIACNKGYTQITFVLLRAGAAKLLKEFPTRQWHGNSLLHEACWLADTTMVKMLLDYLKTVKTQYHSSSGPDYESGVIGAPGQQDQFGATPIMYAIDLRDCTSDRMRTQKSQRRKDCLRLLLEHDIHGDLHSQKYRENIAHVLTTKWTRGPGKGHSIFCYCDEAGDEELTRLLDPFRFQVSPSMRCHATPQCTSLQGSSIRNGSIRSSGTDRQSRVPEFAELMSAPVAWPSNGGGAHFELADNSEPPPSFESATAAGSAGTGMMMSPATATSNGHGNGFVGGLSELTSETSHRSKEQVA